MIIFLHIDGKRNWKMYFFYIWYDIEIKKKTNSFTVFLTNFFCIHTKSTVYKFKIFIIFCLFFIQVLPHRKRSTKSSTKASMLSFTNICNNVLTYLKNRNDFIQVNRILNLYSRLCINWKNIPPFFRRYIFEVLLTLIPNFSIKKKKEKIFVIKISSELYFACNFICTEKNLYIFQFFTHSS